MGAIKDLWASERGLIAVLLIVGATVLAALKVMTVDQWLDYTRWIFITYAAAKTVTGAFQIAKGGTADPEKSKSQVDANQPVPVPSPTPQGNV